MESQTIVTTKDVSYDGKSFTIHREPQSTDVVVQNTEGPIHLKTLMRVLRMAEIIAPSDDELQDYSKKSNYLKDIYTTWKSIIGQLDSEPIDLGKNIGTLGGVKEVRSLPVDIIKEKKNSFRTYRYPVFGTPPDVGKMIPPNSLPLPNDMLLPETHTILGTSPSDSAKGGSHKTPPPTVDTIIKNSARYFFQPPQRIVDATLQYYESYGHATLEGRAIDKLSNTIARSRETPRMGKDVNTVAKEVVKAFSILEKEGKIKLSPKGTHIAPFIPANIEVNKKGVVVDVDTLDQIFSQHMRELENIHTFEKLVNMIANSCLRKECNDRGDTAPAFYTAERFVREFVYHEKFNEDSDDDVGFSMLKDMERTSPLPI